MSDEAYVRSKWVRVLNHGTRRHPIPILNGVEVKIPFAEWDEGWKAAAAFTLQREEEIRQVEEEISLLLNSMPLQVVVIGNTPIPDVQAARSRILAREQAALAELKKGWKEQ